MGSENRLVAIYCAGHGNNPYIRLVNTDGTEESGKIPVEELFRVGVKLGEGLMF